jgi:hypothetical protein
MRSRYPFLRHVALGSLYLLVLSVLAFFAGAVEDRRAAWAGVVVAGVVLALGLRFAKVFLLDALVAGAAISFFVSLGLYDDVRIRRLRKVQPVEISEVASRPPEVILELQGAVARFELSAAAKEGGPAVTPIVAEGWTPERPVEVWAVGGDPSGRPRPVEESRFAFPVPRAEREELLAAARATATRNGLTVAPEPRLVKLVKDPRFELGNRLLLHFYAPVGVYMLWLAGVILLAIASARRSAEPGASGK